MNRRSVRSIALTLLSAALLCPPPAEAANSCATDPRLVGPCFTVRGRLSLYNGKPTQRIWIVGTKRMLGVSEGRFPPDGYSFFPSNMPDPVFDAFYFANFTVCPFTKDKPEVMRLICVQAVTDLRVVNPPAAPLHDR